MATRAELFKELEKAAQSGALDEIQKLSKALDTLNKEEREAKIEATKGERAAWQGLVNEATKELKADNPGFVITVKNIDKETRVLTVGINSEELTNAVRDALKDLLDQAPETVTSMSYDSATGTVTLNSSNTKAPSNGVRSVGWHKGGKEFALEAIYTNHATAEDKAKAKAIMADNVQRGKADIKSQHNADMNTLKKRVAVRNEYTH